MWYLQSKQPQPKELHSNRRMKLGIFKNMKTPPFIRRFIFIPLSLILSLSVWGQSDELPTLAPYFTAIIVSDLDSSILWYQTHLAFSVDNKVVMPERGFGQANLTNGKMKLELIQLNSALDPASAIPDYTSKTRLQGIFKFGFAVDDFEGWLAALKSSDVRFHGDVVTDPVSDVRMIIMLDPDGNRIQLFENTGE